MVVFNFTPEYRGRRAMRPMRWVLTEQCDMAIPNPYGMSVEDLAELLNKYKERYTGAKQNGVTPEVESVE
jgi:hypothetical protein